MAHKLAVEAVIETIVEIITRRSVQHFTRGKQFDLKKSNLYWPVARAVFHKMGTSYIQPAKAAKAT